MSRRPKREFIVALMEGHMELITIYKGTSKQFILLNWGPEKKNPINWTVRLVSREAKKLDVDNQLRLATMKTVRKEMRCTGRKLCDVVFDGDDSYIILHEEGY